MTAHQRREKVVQATLDVVRFQHSAWMNGTDITLLVLAIIFGAVSLVLSILLTVALYWVAFVAWPVALTFILWAALVTPLRVNGRRKRELAEARAGLRKTCKEVIDNSPALRDWPGVLMPSRNDDDAWGLVRALDDAEIGHEVELTLIGDRLPNFWFERGCTLTLDGQRIGQGKAKAGFSIPLRVSTGTHVLVVHPHKAVFREEMAPRVSPFTLHLPGPTTVRVDEPNWREDMQPLHLIEGRPLVRAVPVSNEVELAQVQVVAEEPAVATLPVAAPIPTVELGLLPPGEMASAFQIMAVFALRQILGGASRAVGAELGVGAVDRIVTFLTGRFHTCNDRLLSALTEANQRAWRVVEVMLVGDDWWQRLRSFVTGPEDGALRDEMRHFLDQSGFTAQQRSQCLEELRAARPVLLRVPPIDGTQMATQTAHFARFSDPARLLAADQAVGARLTQQLHAAGCPQLARLLSVEVRPNESLVVVAVRYFFRRAVEEDTQLFQGLAFAQLEALKQDQDKGFASLQSALQRQGHRLEEVLDAVQDQTTQTRGALLNVEEEQRRQGGQVQELYKVVIRLQKRLDLLHGEVRPHHSLSIRSEDELILVREVVARYRALPARERQTLPALLNAVGKLEVAAGDFRAARQDFEQLTALLPDPRARAEAHYNAYHAALEEQAWDRALAELLRAAEADPARFALFPFREYHPQRILGAGGFGVVFLCLDEHGEQVVVKAIRGEQLDGGMERLFAEARTLEKLQHRNIIRPRGHGYTGGADRARPYLVMDYFAGMTLDQLVRHHGPVAPDDLVRLARLVAEALQSAHKCGLLHRDVKPSNLLLRRDPTGWEVRLIDFGLAVQRKVVNETISRADAMSKTLAGRALAGTLDYAAPEQLGKRPGESATPASDVYGFGRTCCFALFATPQPGRKHWQALPESLADLLDDCLRDAPSDRPPTFDTVLQRLDGCAIA